MGLDDCRYENAAGKHRLLRRFDMMLDLY